MKLNSILSKCVQQVYQSKTLSEAQQHMTDLVSNSKIKETDKVKMLDEINKMPSLVKIQFYVTNAMFKYEGLGVGLNKPGEA